MNALIKRLGIVLGLLGYTEAAMMAAAPPLARVAQINVSVRLKPTVTVIASDPRATEVPLNTGTYLVRRTGDNTSPMIVYFSLSGAATNGGDYVKVSTAVTIPARASSAAVTITPKPDATVEKYGEAVILKLVQNSNYVIGSPAEAAITIDDKTNAIDVRRWTLYE